MTPNIHFPIHMYVNKRIKKRNLLIYASIAFVLLAVFIPNLLKNGYTGPRDAIAITTGLLFIFLIYREYKEMKDEKPTMTITERGVQIHKEFFQKMGEVHWSDVGVVSYKGSMIVFSSLHRDPYIAQLSEKEQKDYYQQTRKMGKTSLMWIDASNVDYPQQDFLDLVEPFIAKNKEKKGRNES